MSLNTIHWESCSGKESITYTITDLNQRITNKEFNYTRCDQCGLIRLINPPEDIGEYYPSTYHDFPTLKNVAAIAKKSRCKIESVLKFVSQGKLLEIGPSYGLFCYQAKEAGFEVQAIEMDKSCCKYLEETIGIQATQSDRPEVTLGELDKQDVIALWHVIEHLTDPWALIKTAYENLNSGGILVLAAPNPESWQFKVMAEKWPHLDAPRHMYLIPIKMLTEFCASVGLERVYVTTNDSEAKGWNRFGWQRWLMNRFRNRVMQTFCYFLGYGVALLLSPFESGEPKGSAYTIVFRKK